MKRDLCVIVSFLLLALFSEKTAAQDYMGGSASISLNRLDNKHGDRTFSAALSPDIGWFVADDFVVGLRPSVSFSRQNQSEYTAFGMGIAPYFRYALLDYKRLGLWAEGVASLSFHNDWYHSKKNHNTVNYQLRVLPVLTYALNSHLLLESRVNLFSFGLSGSASRVADWDDRGYRYSDWDRSASFGMSLSPNDCISALGDISIGFIYRF